MLEVYGDESHDERRERAFAVAGLLGSESDWLAAKAAWLERTGGVLFHAATCETEFAGDPDRGKHRQNLKLYADLTKILARSNLLGFGAVMDLAGWKAAVPLEAGTAVNSVETAYYLCFSEVVIHFGRIAALSIPPEKVRFVFDRNIEREFNAHRLYTHMAQTTDWPHGIHLADEMSTATIETPGIQMADLVAREAMKWLDNEVGPVKRPQRRSLETLAASGRFRIVQYTPEYSKAFIESAMKTVVWRDGLTSENYQAWLLAKGLRDSMSSRISFLARHTPRRE